MATLLVHIRVKEGFETEFEAIADELYEETHRHEHVLRYEYWRSQSPGCWYALESFERYADFLAHQSSEYHERLAPRLREIMEEINLEWIDPLPGASPLPSTAEPTEDLGELAQRYPLRRAEWWTNQ